MTAINVLLVDDDAEATASLARALVSRGSNACMLTALTAAQALKIFREAAPHVVVLDLSLDAAQGVASGFSLLRLLQQEPVPARIIVLTGHAGVEYGIRALQLGAASFLEKPANIDHLLALLSDGIAQTEIRRHYQKSKQREDDQLQQLIVGSSLRAQTIRQAVSYASQTKQSVLICGETGTGKGLCARAIHQLSDRHPRRMVSYQPRHCGSDLTSSDLFGHARGAFTGAQTSREGLIREADGGTLFLDEVDELPLETQVSLLEALQEKCFRPLGSDRVIQSDFRLIAATNQNIDQALASGKLRKDFFHRIAHAQIYLPPLRERRSDIPEIAEHLLNELRKREGIQVFSIDHEAQDRLLSGNWPGNIRELAAVIEGAAYRAQHAGRLVLIGSDIQLNFGSTQYGEESFQKKIERYKLSLISEALAATAGNQVQAAAKLGLDRSSLRRILIRQATLC